LYRVVTLSGARRAPRLAIAALALATLSLAGTSAEAGSRHKRHGGQTNSKQAPAEAGTSGNVLASLFSGTADKPDAGKANSRGTARGSAGAAGTGIASFYGGRHHGGPTASGERFNQNAMTAAHRSAPLGSQMRVTNLNNGKSVVVRINDRGPYIGGRIIDVSKGAAEALGFISAGLARVKLERV
jgi:rare lipoprotein A